MVPGARELKRGAQPAWGLSLYTPVIVKYRDDKTDLSSTLEDSSAEVWMLLRGSIRL